MSRHRNVKQLVDDDYYDDYDDDYYDEGYDDYDDYTGGSAQVQQTKKKQSAAKKAPAPVKPKQQQQSATNNTKKDNKTSAAKGPTAPPAGFSAAAPQTKATPQSATVSAEKTTPSVTTAASGTPQAAPPPVPAILRQQQADNNSKTTNKKVPITVVVLGHVDAGKSTVTGHLLYGSSSMSGSSAGNKQGRNSTVNYAWLLDEDSKEQAHGITMDIATKQLETTNFQVVLQDAPGHAEYVPQMITGTSSADAALLTVDATDLHTALHKSGGGQLREHVYLARGLGVNQILVVFNKMDLVGWDNATQYAAMEAQLRTFLIQQVGYPASKVRCVPVSGLTGTNIFSVANKSSDDDTMKLRSWYKGPTLQEALDQFEPPIKQQQNLLEKPLRIVVSDVLDGSGTGVAVRAKVVAGWAKQGEPMVVLPVGDETTLTKLSSLHSNSVETQQKASERRLYCVAGEVIDCTVANIDAQRISTGSILARPNFRPPLASRCRAKIFVLDGITIPLIRGAQAIFHMHHLDIPCNIAVLVRTLKPDGTSVLKERPRALTKSCNAIVELQLAVPVCMEAFADCRALGRFVLRRSGDSIAVGRIEEVMLPS